MQLQSDTLHSVVMLVSQPLDACIAVVQTLSFDRREGQNNWRNGVPTARIYDCSERVSLKMNVTNIYDPSGILLHKCFFVSVPIRKQF